jgi:hypothetical protein
VTRVQAESVTSSTATKVYDANAEHDNGSMPNASRFNSNDTVNYLVTVPDDTTAGAIVVRSGTARTSTGRVWLNVVDGSLCRRERCPLFIRTPVRRVRESWR